MMAAAFGGTFNDSIFSSMHNYCCKLCEQPITNPQVLSCLHVLCEQCLMYLIYAAQGDLNKDDYSINCPDCKKTVTIGFSETLATPYAISTSFFCCSSCMKDTNSVSRCHYCERLYCLGCFRGHTYVICHIADDAKRFINCSQHNMECKYYCPKCEILACVFCLAKQEHDDHHDYISIAEAESRVHNHIQQQLDNAKEHTNQCYETISCLLGVQTDLRSKHESAREELTCTFQSFLNFCNKNYNDATNELDSVYATQEGKVKELLHEIENFSLSVANSCKEAKRLLMEANSLTLCRFGALVPVKLSEMNSIPSIELNEDNEKAFQNVVDNFHEKMNLNLVELTALIEAKPLKVSGSPAGSSSTALECPTVSDRVSLLTTNSFKRTPLLINVKYKFGTLGDLHIEFNNPSGFCLDQKEDIIIADKHNHRIQIFRKNGTFKFKFGMAGKIDGHLWFPSKVAALRKDNRFVVADQGIERWRLQIFSKNGIFIKKIPFYGIAIVAAMVVTNDGLIIVVDQTSSFIFIITEFGDVVRHFECKNYIWQASDVAVHGTEIFICDYKAHCVAVFSTTGIFQRYIGNKDVFSYPNGIHVTEDDVFVSDADNTRFHVARFERNGTFKTSYVCMQMKVSHCHGFKMNSTGDAFTVSKSNHCMFIMDKMSFQQ